MQATAFDTPPWWQRVLPMFRGFDGPLLAAVLLLAGLGLTIMYSSGFDHGTRFVMHGRNMLLAAAIMFVVAQAPPQRLMRLAVPVYTVGVLLLVAVALLAILAVLSWRGLDAVVQSRERLVTESDELRSLTLAECGRGDSAQRDHEDCRAAHAGLLVSVAAGAGAQPGGGLCGRFCAAGRAGGAHHEAA